MKLALVLCSNDPETMNNAFRLGLFATAAGDDVTVFLLGAGVEIEHVSSPEFNVQEKALAFLEAGGDILACGTCLEQRGYAPSEFYIVSNLKALHDLIADYDKVVSF